MEWIKILELLYKDTHMRYEHHHVRATLHSKVYLTCSKDRLKIEKTMTFPYLDFIHIHLYTSPARPPHRYCYFSLHFFRSAIVKSCVPWYNLMRNRYCPLKPAQATQRILDLHCELGDNKAAETLCFLLGSEINLILDGSVFTIALRWRCNEVEMVFLWLDVFHWIDLCALNGAKYWIHTNFLETPWPQSRIIVIDNRSNLTTLGLQEARTPALIQAANSLFSFLWFQIKMQGFRNKILTHFLSLTVDHFWNFIFYFIVDSNNTRETRRIFPV